MINMKTKTKKLNSAVIQTAVYVTEWSFAFILAITGNAGVYLTFAFLIAILTLILKK